MDTFAEKKFLELVESLVEAADDYSHYTDTDSLEKRKDAAAELNAARDAIHAHHAQLLDALNRLKLRIHFIDWPGESMWNGGSEEKPHWVPDWRYECHLLEHVLHGSEITTPEKPTDTKRRIEVTGPKFPSGTPTWFVAHMPGWPGGIDFETRDEALRFMAREGITDDVSLSFWLHQAHRIDYTPEQTRDLLGRYKENSL